MLALNLDEIRRRNWVATYPTREAALALVEWIKADGWQSVSELDRRLAGIGIEWTDSFCVAAERCFEVYGYPELESANVARRISDAFMRPRLSDSGKPTGRDQDQVGTQQPEMPNASVAPAHESNSGYGFQRKA
ncbi:MAG: hypothetical protein E5Y30_11855 [Mesorhizobium sp.]|nr:MAG: hypothetical protein E5Y30_11855 [Mesorhizobium sp.]